MSPKGLQIAAHKARYMLLHGPRKSGKSNTCQNMLLEHAWKMDRARIGIFSGNLKAGAEGTYEDLVKKDGRVDEWIEGLGAAGFKMTKEPTFETDTKMRYFRVRNRHGTESEIQVHSIDREDRVATRFKQMRFSLIYLCEADGFQRPETMKYLSDQLRVEHLKYEDHRFLIDTNPAEDGEDHWLYQEFKLDDLGRTCRHTNPEYAAFHVTLDDNPFLSDKEKMNIHDNWAYDQDMLDRFYYGLWKKSKSGAIFERQFRENHHIIGDVSSVNTEDHTILTPDQSCFELPSGWDLGDSLNHGIVLGAKRIVGNLPVFDIIDEWSSQDKNTTPEEIAAIYLEKKRHWTRWMKNAYGKEKLHFKEWSDSSANRFIVAARNSMAGELSKVSHGEIQLVGVRKDAGSVEARIEMLKRLLYEDRLFISASCTHVIEMLKFIKYLKSDSRLKKRHLDPYSKFKHIFDALTYMLANENAIEVSRNYRPNESNSVIYVPA
jgi:hypothetical protein